MLVMGQHRNRERIKSAAAVAVLHALFAYALITGFSLRISAEVADQLRVFDVIEPPPPPVEESAPARAPEEAPKEAAAPPNLRAEATPVVAPPPRVRLPVPPAVAAPVPGTGSDPSAGASDRPGPGTGAGGTGTGTGGGGAGGSGGGVATSARLIRGGISDWDYPRAARRAGIQGTVNARLVIGADGRVTDCRVARSSGSAELDEATCRLILRRFRFAPARDAQGRNVPDRGGWVQRWWIREPPPLSPTGP